MLTEIYIQALLVDEEAADQVWEAWDKGEIDDSVAAWAWWSILIKYGWLDEFIAVSDSLGASRSKNGR